MVKRLSNKITAKLVSACLIVMLVLAALPVYSASADTSGAQNAGTGTDNAAVGTVAWGNPGNITAAGTPYASMSVNGLAVTHYLQGTNYGFSVPTNAIINGIAVTINRQSTGTGGSAQMRDSGVFLLKAGAVVGTNAAVTGANWSSISLGTATYGGASNLWGTTWTPADINDANFGVVLSARNANNSATRTATVDYMQITVTYTLPGPATKLVITSSAVSTTAGVASSAITVQRQDINNIPNTTDGTISLTLSSSSSGTFTFNPPNPQITSGSSSVTFTYTDTLAGTPTIQVASAGLTSATQQETVTAAAPSSLAMQTEPSSTVSAGGLFTIPPAVKVVDTYGNVVKTDSSTVTASVLTGTGPLNGTTTAVASNGVATFGLLAAPLTEQNNLTLRFTDGGLTPVDDTTVITVNKATATKLVVSGTGTVTAGGSLNLTITAKDDSGTTIAAYTGAKNLTFSGANSSPNPVTTPKVKDSSGTSIAFGTATSINFTSGVATVSANRNGVMTLYKAETAVVCVTDGTISSAISDCLTVVVSPAAASKLAFTTAPVTIPAGVASSSITVEREDAYGNPNKADATRTVTLSSNTTGTATFNPASPLTISMGSSSASFTYTDTMGGTPTITASSSGITSATQQETVSAGTPTVTSGNASAIKRTSATLNGTVNAAGGSVTVTFEYGTSASYGTTITATQSPVTGTTNTAVSAQIPGTLTPGTLYHFRVVGVTGALTLQGSDKTFTTTSAGGTIYYVDNTNGACSESGTGTISVPFCTIGAGATVADAGDTVNVVAGTYAETVQPKNNGGTGMPITFTAANGVTVTGLAGNSTNGGGFRLFSKGYIVIDGFTIHGTADYGIIVTASNHIRVTNNHVSNSGSTDISGTLLRSGIYFTATTDSFIIGNTSDHNSSDGIRLNNGSNNNWIEKNVVFGNATVHWNQATGINLLKNSNNNTLIRNTTYANEDTGLNFYTGSSHNAVINNVTYGNGDHGIDNNGAPYNLFSGNTVQGNVTVGINLEQDSSGNGSGGATLANNISVDNGYRRLTDGTTFGTSNGGNLRVDNTSITKPAATNIDYDLIYSATGGVIQVTWGTTTYTSLSAFQSTGQEVHGLQANPLFYAPAPIAARPTGDPFNMAINVGDYHINSGSPAIDSANSDALGEQTTDFDGLSRVDDPATANTGTGTRAYDDRGAYEYQLKTDQTISWTSAAPASATVGGNYTPTATATSGLPVTITVDATASSVCSINGAGLVTFIGVGTCVLDANQPGSILWNAASQMQQSFPVGKASQTISVTTHAPTSAAVNSSFTVAATATSGLTVNFTATGVCTNLLGTFTMTSSTGTCTVHYNQAGNSLYFAAPEITETVNASNLAQVITVTTHAPANAAYNSGFTVAATGGASGNPIVYTASGVCTNNGPAFTMTSGTGVCTVHYNQDGNANYAPATEVTEAVNATKLNQTINFPAPASPAAYHSTFDVAPTASSGLVVSVTPSGACSILGSTVTMTSGTGTCTLTASQAGDANYNAASNIVRTVTAEKATQTIVITKHVPPSAAYLSSFTVAATSTSGLAVVFSATGVCNFDGTSFTMTSASGICTVHFNQPGDTNNVMPAPEITEDVSARNLAQVITVTKHAPANAANNSTFTVAATGGASGNPVVYTSTGICTNSGPVFTMTSGTGTCSVHYNQAGDSNYAVATEIIENVTAQTILKVYLPLIIR